jgi:outer membrane protein assembly factor BamE (lipoprotein component of BamABCDE complex)
MSKKWWCAIVAMFLTASVLVFAIPALVPPTPGITYANYSRIEKGMSRAEVEALLGKPKEKSSIIWENADDDLVTVVFDRNGKVESAAWNHWPDDRNALQKLMDRLPWFQKPPPPRIRVTTEIS